MMTPIRIPYIEKALGISIQTLEGFENERCASFACATVCLMALCLYAHVCVTD